MTINYNAIQKQAEKLARNAKPGMMRHNKHLYTFVFDQNAWVYQVYEDGLELIRFNTKRLSTSKKYLREWLDS